MTTVATATAGTTREARPVAATKVATAARTTSGATITAGISASTECRRPDREEASDDPARPPRQHVPPDPGQDLEGHPGHHPGLVRLCGHHRQARCPKVRNIHD